MEAREAMIIVHAMARELYEGYGEIVRPARNPKHAEQALEMVDDMIAVAESEAEMQEEYRRERRKEEEIEAGLHLSLLNSRSYWDDVRDQAKYKDY